MYKLLYTVTVVDDDLFDSLHPLRQSGSGPVEHLPVYIYSFKYTVVVDICWTFDHIATIGARPSRTSSCLRIFVYKAGRLCKRVGLKMR